LLSGGSQTEFELQTYLSYFKQKGEYIMEQQKFRIAYSIAKFVEVCGWIAVVFSVIAGLGIAANPSSSSLLGESNVLLGIFVIVFGALVGLAMVMQAQLTLAMLDTEGNTREAREELKRSNTMLGETLGVISTSVKKIAEGGKLA
jgi:hypothetical protein